MKLTAYFKIMVMKLPLGIIYFTIAIVGSTLAIAFVLSPLTFLLEPLGITTINNTETWVIPIAFVVGIFLAPGLLHFAKWVGKVHGEMAKGLLVPPMDKKS